MKRERYTHYPRTILWLVRGGRVTVGGAEDDAQPRFEVDVAPFYISKWPITNEQFEAFDPAFERAPVSPGDRDTAVGVSYQMAEAYADWYAGVSRKAMRLPTEVEWEHACRGDCSDRYFWGDDPAAGDAFVWDRENSSGVVPPADKTRPNDFGLHSLLGGVWEWTSSRYRPYPLETPADEPKPGAPRVLRGGSFRSPRSRLSCSVRRAAEVTLQSDEVGFRIARSFP